MTSLIKSIYLETNSELFETFSSVLMLKKSSIYSNIIVIPDEIKYINIQFREKIWQLKIFYEIFIQEYVRFMSFLWQDYESYVGD